MEQINKALELADQVNKVAEELIEVEEQRLGWTRHLKEIVQRHKIIRAKRRVA